MRPPINNLTSAPSVTELTEDVAGGSLRRMVGLRQRHQIGRHLLAMGDGGDWCRRCGDFDIYLKQFDGTPTECHPTPKAERWWPQRLARTGEQANAELSDRASKI